MVEMKTTQMPAPFRDYLFRVAEDGYIALFASRCDNCDKIMFPRVSICPACSSENIEKTEIGPEAELFTYSRAHMPVGAFKPPFVVGYGLVAGVRVFAPVIDLAPELLQVGAVLELRPYELKSEDGKAVLSYAFYPAEGERNA